MNMAEPLVSVVLPTYNHAPYIDAAIRSAVEQDYDNLEVLVGDDGSTDGTADRIVDLGERSRGRIVPIVGGPHLGITGNCNRILKACRGTYFALHAGDDVYLPGKVRKQVAWLEADPSRVLCGHAVENFDSTTGKTVTLSTQSMKLHSGRGAARLIRNFGLFSGPSIMVRASAVPPFGYDDRIPTVSDFKFQIDILGSDGAYGYVDGVLARSRIHPDSVSQKSRRDPEIHRHYLEEFLVTLALVEATYPALVGACRRARAHLYFNEARWRQQHDDLRACRAYLRAASAMSPATYALKSVVAALLTFAPRPVQQGVERVLVRHRQA
jgi:glycosyltransferase involved in cell wall biosynthesis